MAAELVHVETPDGLRLDGALQLPSCAATMPVDAFLLVHGTGSNFYAPGVLETFARLGVESGCAVLRINTRGHDGMASIYGKSRSARGGATYETIADCRHDLVAWIVFLADRGYRRIVLVGHSMGGVKAFFAQAHDPHPSVVAIIGVSPPRFCHERLAAGTRGERFRAEFARMQESMTQGQGEALVPVTQPLPFVATPAGYLEKYGPDNRYDFVRFLPQVACPVLILIGSESAAHSSAFDGLPETLQALGPTCPHVELQVVAGANINYANDPQAPFERVAAWLTRMKSSSG
jgi:alpha-beta hydrolase superfamily lysophospholipase